MQKNNKQRKNVGAVEEACSNAHGVRRYCGRMGISRHSRSFLVTRNGPYDTYCVRELEKERNTDIFFIWYCTKRWSKGRAFLPKRVEALGLPFLWFPVVSCRSRILGIIIIEVFFVSCRVPLHWRAESCEIGVKSELLPPFWCHDKIGEGKIGSMLA